MNTNTQALREALEKIERSAQAGLCQMTHAGTREFLKDIRIIVSETLAAQPPAPEQASGGQRANTRMLHDFPVLQQFHTKHALGPMLPPSCLCCGQQTHPISRPVAVKHLELPGIVICKQCKDAATPTAEPAVEAVPKGWQPIETAPKDGTVILVADSFTYRNDPEKKPHHVYRAVRWYEEGGWEIYNDGEIIDEDGPTYWMPLPAEPGSASTAAPDAEKPVHDSDCSLHNEPAYPAGPCDCSLAAKPEQQAQAGEPSGCACRWDKDDNRVQTCERHQGWLDVVHEWAERAKAAEGAIAKKDAALKAQNEALRIFVSCKYPVSKQIDERGYRWSEAYLDQTLPIAKAAITQAEGARK